MPPSLHTYASRPIVVCTGFDKLVGVDMRGVFPNGGLTGVPVVTCVLAEQDYDEDESPGAVLPGDLTFATPIVNTGAFTSDTGRTVAIGEGVQVQVHGCSSVDGGDYTLKVTATDGTNTDSLLCIIQVRGIGQEVP